MSAQTPDAMDLVEGLQAENSKLRQKLQLRVAPRTDNDLAAAAPRA